MTPLGIGLVGAGSIAADHVAALSRVPWARLRSITSRRAQDAAMASREWGFERSTSTLFELVSDSDVDVVLICTPHHLHVEQALVALEAGKHVIIEVPAALTAADLDRLLRGAEESEGRVLVCHTMRSFPAIRWLRAELARSGQTIRLIAGAFDIPRRRNEGLSGLPRQWPDDILWHHGTHLIDCSLWLLGSSEWTGPWATLGPRDRRTGMILDAACGFRGADGAVVAHTLSYNSDEFRWALSVHTEKGQYQFENGSITRPPDRDPIATSSIRDLFPQDHALLTALRTGAPSEFDLASIVESMALVSALSGGSGHHAAH